MVNLKTYLIFRIIFTFLFILVSTTVWFTRTNNIYYEVKTKIQSNDVTISNLKRISNSDNTVYNLKLKNKENSTEKFKVYIVPTVSSNCVSNNYIKYQVNDNSIKTLNMDGMIIIDKLEALEDRNINIKLWISDTYDGNLNFNGRVVVG